MSRHTLYDVISNLDDVLALCRKNKYIPEDVCGNTLLDWVNVGIVGWDEGCQSYCYNIETSNPDTTWAVGTDYKEIPTYQHLIKSLNMLFTQDKDIFIFSDNKINTKEDEATKAIIRDSKKGVLMVDYYHQYGDNSGNIIWPIELGLEDATHPVRSVKFDKEIPIEKFRALGYFASCFPEGDGITLTDESRLKSPQKVMNDIEECFGWKTILKNGDKLI
jgi:hypothetical protein